MLIYHFAALMFVHSNGSSLQGLDALRYIAQFEQLYEIREQILKTKDSESAPIVLAGNKCDLDFHRVDKAELDQLAKTWNCPAYFTSAKTKVNISEVFHQCVREIIRYRDMEIDAAEEKDTGNCQCSCGCIVL